MTYKNKKKFPLSVVLMISLTLGAVTTSAAQESNDSTATDLKEVVVEGTMQTATAQKVSYRPSQRVKNASQDAIDLLRRMAIPQLTIDPVSQAVTTAGGGAVGIFINYLPARDEDIRGLRTTDVRSVECLDYPTDPRFGGVLHAVNIIVREYEYGGYTKLSDRQFAFTNFSNYASVFSKFSYRKMTYDLYVGADNVSATQIGDSESSVFRLPSGDISRDKVFRGSDFKYLILPVSFRAVYTGKNIQIVNTVGFQFNNRFRNLREGELRLHPSVGVGYEYATDAPHTDRTLAWNGNYYFALPHEWSLTASPQLAYTHNNTRSTYTTTIPGESPIVNDTREDAWLLGLTASLRRSFAGRHTLSFDASAFSSLNDMDYMGTSPYTSDMSSTDLRGSAHYTLNLPAFSLSAGVGVEGFITDTGIGKERETTPRADMSLNFVPNRKNYASLSAEYYLSAIPLSLRSPNVIQANELLYRTGNPWLDNSGFAQLSASYTWLPNNHLNLTAYATYNCEHRRVVTDYSLYDEGNALLQSYLNSGNFTRLTAGLNGTLRLLSNSLVLQVSPSLTHYKSTGILPRAWTPFEFDIYGQYYFGNFNIGAYCSTQACSMDSRTAAKTTSRSYWRVEAGWGNGTWNLSVVAMNLFRSGYDGTRVDTDTPLYSGRSVLFNGNYRRSVLFNVIYTFGYGRQIRRGNEVGRQSGANSAIME